MMEKFEQKIEIRWSDLDPNFHVLHSKYYDFAAQCRISFLEANGLTMSALMKFQIGPILFREECVFKKELRFGDAVMIQVKLKSSNQDFSRWTMVHEIYKDENILAALITVDGAWMNTAIRKLAVPPDEIKNVFLLAPKTMDFLFT